MKVPDWFDPDELTCRIVRPPPRGYPPNVDSLSSLGVARPGAPLRHSDVLITPGWVVPTRSKTVDYLPRQRFLPQEAIHRPVGNGKIRAEHHHHV
jgi:hypothetical protein